MRKLTIKGILKTAATAAAVVTMMVGFGSTAKAEEFYFPTDEEIAAMVAEAEATGYEHQEGVEGLERCTRAVAEKYGISYEEAVFTTKYAEEAQEMCWGKEACERLEQISAEYLARGGVTADVATTAQTKMLNLVNKDRKVNGAGNLVWNADLEVIAKKRAVMAFENTQTQEYADALNSGDYAKQCEIVHSRSVEGVSENAIVSYYSNVEVQTINDNWIKSEGHHVVRINPSFTKYACASYTDPFTCMETWVEIFADDNYPANSSSFDYMRYATENPDVAAVFGQNRDALYNHYITCGVIEGRTGYCIDGTICRY